MGKYLLACFALICLASCALAITNASVTEGGKTRWDGNISDVTSVQSEGGNITNVNISTVTLTDNWMGFFGNVMGSIVLGNNLAYMYNWSWQPSSNGEVCVAQNSLYDFSSINSTNAGSINTAWQFGGISDNATNTYNQPICNLTIGTQQVNNTASAKHGPNSTFRTCAISRGPAANSSDFAYCAGINNGGRNYLNQSVQYELLVPSKSGSLSDPYYFFAELN